MIISKLQLGFASALVAVLAAGVIWSVRENSQLRALVAEESAAASAGGAELKRKLAAESQRAAMAEAELAELLKTAKAMAASRAAAPGPTALPTDTQDFLKAAMARAAALIAEGKQAEALEEYVRAYRELQAKRPGSSECQSLMGSIKYLGRTFPPAIAALGGLRDSAMTQWTTQKAPRELVFEIALLNERLGEGSRSLALYDSLPAGDRSRESVVFIAYQSFADAGRYDDALLGKSAGSMLRNLNAGIQHAGTETGDRLESMRKSIVATALTGIEVLTGAGKAEEARLMTETLFTFDGSEATRSAVAQRVERAAREKKQGGL